MDCWHWSLQWNLVLMKYKLLSLQSWHNQGMGLASSLNLVLEMLSNEPGCVSYSKLVRSDVVRCPRLNRQGVTESRAKEMGLWSYPISEGSKRMTLLELHQRKRVHSTLTGRSAVFFKRRKIKISPRGLPILLSITMAVIP